MIFFSDMHIHTDASACCNSITQTPDIIIPLLAQMGYRKIGFTDHAWVSKNIPANNFYKGQNGDANIELHDFIHSREWDIEVLVGCETDMIAPGVFGMTDEFKAKMDYIVMATDHFHMKDFVQQPSERTPRAIAEHMLKFFISAAGSGIPDALVHPFFPFGYTDIYDESIMSISDAEFLDVFSVAAENNVGIEINKCYLPKPQYNFFFSLETPIRILTLAKQAGCKFTLGSDSHALKSFHVLEKLQALAGSIGIGEEDIHPIAKA